MSVRGGRRGTGDGVERLQGGARAVCEGEGGTTTGKGCLMSTRYA
jgi:hypothetical protein